MAGNLPEGAPGQVAALLDGRTPSNNPQAEAYRLLLVHACNLWHGPMPFLFEEIDDYTELLMPEDLLSQTSILAELRKVMTEDACQDVEIIGWLYQFYISEKKDQVFAGLKKNQKITAENIPAATQLFTPHWIVRYLVENSLGRLWLLNRPQSRLAERMDYYIAPEEPETDFLKIGKPEEIKVCDPACGSGHMLTYAFDLLYAIYEEEGYEATEIPALILTHNLTGVEIDDRAGALAAFALAMKAAARLGRRRFLRMNAKPDICVLQIVSFTPAEMQDVAAVVGKDLFTDELRETLGQFEQAKNFGSLIVPKLRNPAETLRVVGARDFGGDLLLKEVQERVIAVLRMAEALSPQYHVVVANPPYMGSGGMNPLLKDWLGDHFPVSKADLMTAFMERAVRLTLHCGYMSMINLPSWIFISSFEKLRVSFLDHARLTSMLHCGRGLFGSDFGAVAFSTINESTEKDRKGVFRRLFTRHVEVRKPEVIQEIFLDKAFQRYTASNEDFEKIPGRPIAYWVPDNIRDLFLEKPVRDYFELEFGIKTGDNDAYLRLWHEVAERDTNIRPAGKSHFIKHNKGGEYRKWYGNGQHVINWKQPGKLMNVSSGTKADSYTSFRTAGVTWSEVTSGSFCTRYLEGSVLSNNKGPAASTDEQEELLPLLGLTNTVAYRRV
jgi:hypothetical protein